MRLIFSSHSNANILSANLSTLQDVRFYRKIHKFYQIIVFTVCNVLY